MTAESEVTESGFMSLRIMPLHRITLCRYLPKVPAYSCGFAGVPGPATIPHYGARQPGSRHAQADLDIGRCRWDPCRPDAPGEGGTARAARGGTDPPVFV